MFLWGMRALVSDELPSKEFEASGHIRDVTGSRQEKEKTLGQGQLLSAHSKRKSRCW